MSIRLAWANTNPSADSVIVYRSDTPFTETTLPTPLATLAGNATTYDDTTIVRNTVMYYRIKIVKGTDELITPQLIQGHFPDSGPGPQTLLRGDWRLGYFGRVPVAQMWSISQFRTACGATSLGSAPSEGYLVYWHKFIRNGKILFIPSAPLSSTGISWQNIYSLGLVYGTNDNGKMPPGMTSPPAPVNQYKPITLGAYTFIPRLAVGCTLPLDVIATTFATNLEGSEWDELMGRSYLVSGIASNNAKFDDCVVSVQPCAITQHIVTTNPYSLQRGNGTTIDYAGAIATGNNTAWIPVVELVP